MSRGDRRRLASSAPRAATSSRPYLDLLAAAGFVETGRRDLTGEYLATTRAWLAQTEPRRDAVAAVDGEQMVSDRLNRWREAIDAVERGWLLRTMYWGRRPC